MWEIFWIVVVLGAIAVLAAPWLRRRGKPADAVNGTLVITGVSPKPEAVTGEQFVTVTGVINGPTVNEHVVYWRYAVDVEHWQLIDRHERTTGEPHGRPRVKLANLEDLLRIGHG